MTTRIDFDLLQFQPLTWGQFKRRYVGVIQPLVIWNKIRSPRTGIKLLAPGESVSLVWYQRGDWRDGKPKIASAGRALALARVPAVRHLGRFIVLDGCHRLTQLRPAMILLDWFEPRSADRAYITDLFNPAHANGKR